MRFLRWLLPLIFVTSLAHAQSGYLVRDDCTTLTPVQFNTVCLNTGNSGTLTQNKLYTYGVSGWDPAAPSSTTPTLQAVKDSGNTITNAVDTSTCLMVGNGTIHWCWYADSSNVLTEAVVDSSGTAVAVDRIYKADANKTIDIQDSSGTSVFKITDTSGVGAISAAKGLVSGFSIPIARDGGLQDTDDFNNIVRIPFAQTITQVCAITDTGTSSINIQRNDGSAANILSSNLTAATTEACTTSFVSGENILSEGHYINFVMVTAAASGTPTKVTVSVKTTRN